MEFIELIKEPTFWIISSIGSVFLSVAANLVTPYIGKIVGKIFATRKTKIEKKKQLLINEVRYVSSDQNKILKEGANKRGNSSRLTQSFHFFMFEPIFSPVNALNQPI
ncbi:hypothetical protein [Aeromonas veronii]|uniref:hypothetical protein n=2 Tax=Aeromonas veronii TaxID=654 RepID=UPI002B49EBAC|nr:hypothetical protein [Aeromonas veronii]